MCKVVKLYRKLALTIYQDGERGGGGGGGRYEKRLSDVFRFKIDLRVVPNIE